MADAQTQPFSALEILQNVSDERKANRVHCLQTAWNDSLAVGEFLNAKSVGGHAFCSRMDPELYNIAVPMIVNGVSHPIEYAKVLIQIGYEPIPPRRTTTIFNRPALSLPNVFQYVRYIKSVDGFSGCYRGLIPKLCAYTVCNVAFKRTSNCIEVIVERFENKENDRKTSHRPKKRGVYEFLQELVSKMIAIIISHPLDVIMLRMMAQFVGGETKYKSFVEVYRENGIKGYYAGIVPRLIGHAAVSVLISSSTYVIDKYVISDRELKPYAASTINFIASTITYPFLVVSHCMAVNDCGLIAGLPPQMPIYNSWLDCWSHLSATNQLKRGSSLLWRYYTGPQVVINGNPIPITKENFHLLNTTQ